MEEKLSQKSWRMGILTISWREITLLLKRNFNTAHSSSSQRHNFIIRIEVEGRKEKGFGQCGLPPKKPHCYFADVDDCDRFMSQLGTKIKNLKLQEEKENVENMVASIFEGIPSEYFSSLRSGSIKLSPLRQILENLIILLFHSRQCLELTSLAARSALEFAILDLSSRLAALPLSSFIFPEPSPHIPCSFYTISYDSQSQMVENAKEGVNFTHFIKIKYIDDIQSLTNILKKIEEGSKGVIEKYIIDANASWSPQSCLKFNDVLSKNQVLKQKILYLEQPFPVTLTQGEIQQWKDVAQRSHVKIVADESICNWEQLEIIGHLCQAVNIKTEKAGGAINSIRTAIEAKKRGLEIMLGSMVSTHLGCTQTYSLHPLTQYLDVDGALLVREPQLEGGFMWKNGGFLSYSSQLHGTGITADFFEK